MERKERLNYCIQAAARVRLTLLQVMSLVFDTANPSDDLPVNPIISAATSRKPSCNNAGGRRIQCTRPSLTRLSTIYTSFRRVAESTVVHQVLSPLAGNSCTWHSVQTTSTLTVSRQRRATQNHGVWEREGGAALTVI
ncbi:hypothetical protein B0H12DRAFT_1104048 [Mycena haematopus]|nr:hypothetical protein B0H12DRAFT_1104048 [Mycena haematopus]